MFVFTHNMPGYLPESDPEVYATWADAKQAAIDYMDKEGDFLAQSEDAQEVDNADELSGHMEDLNLDSGPEWTITVGNVAYSITQVTAHELNENILQEDYDVCAHCQRGVRRDGADGKGSWIHVWDIARYGTNPERCSNASTIATPMLDRPVVAHAWPGGYRVWYVTSDAASLCAECVQAELVQCVDPDSGGWYVEGYYSEADADECGPCDNCGRVSDIAND